jgi:hypothetical protein
VCKIVERGRRRGRPRLERPISEEGTRHSRGRRRTRGSRRASGRQRGRPSIRPRIPEEQPQPLNSYEEGVSMTDNSESMVTINYYRAS